MTKAPVREHLATTHVLRWIELTYKPLVMSAPSPDAVLHLAALHTLAATGFASTSRAASVTLSSTLARYLRLVALTCTERASLAGRNKVAAIDVLQALEELGVGGVAELHEWTVGLDQEVCLATPGLAGLGEELRDGLGDEVGYARMKLVSDEEAHAEVDEDWEIVEEEGEDVDHGMGVDEVDTVKVESPGRTSKLRFPSPDFSWLPPLPGGEVIPDHTTHSTHAVTEEHTATTAVAPALSIIDRYRRRIPFSQSELSSLRPFNDPPSAPPSLSLPTASSSFSSLSTAYAATRGEPSVALRQMPLRSQAIELLRRTVAAPDEYNPDDTLVVQTPGPRSTPIVPSHSESPGLHAHAIPLNPNPTGLLSRMVHMMQSPHLPTQLRDRLTSVRPPQPQDRGGLPVLYGEAVRGPGEAALARARGKLAEAEEMDQGFVQATWHAPPRGLEKWGQRLPTGKKVMQSGKGEDRPRVPPGTRPAGIPGRGVESDPAGSSSVEHVENPPTPGAPGKIRLRLSTLDAGGSSATPGSLSPLPPVVNGFSPGPADSLNLSAPQSTSTNAEHVTSNNLVSSSAVSTPGPTGIKLKLGFADQGTELATTPNTPSVSSPAGATPGPTGIKLKLGLPKRPSESLSPGPPIGDISTNGASPGLITPVNAPSPRPILSLKIGSRSISPFQSASPNIKSEPMDEDVTMHGDGEVHNHDMATGNGNGNGNGHGHGNGPPYVNGHIVENGHSR